MPFFFSSAEEPLGQMDINRERNKNSHPGGKYKQKEEKKPPQSSGKISAAV